MAPGRDQIDLILLRKGPTEPYYPRLVKHLALIQKHTLFARRTARARNFLGPDRVSNSACQLPCCRYPRAAFLATGTATSRRVFIRSRRFSPRAVWREPRRIGSVTLSPPRYWSRVDRSRTRPICWAPARTLSGSTKRSCQRGIRPGGWTFFIRFTARFWHTQKTRSELTCFQ
jgi:hypothetical protein